MEEELGCSVLAQGNKEGEKKRVKINHMAASQTGVRGRKLVWPRLGIFKGALTMREKRDKLEQRRRRYGKETG